VSRLATAGAALVAVWLAVAAALFVWPHDDEPIAGRADAVVSLAGSKARLPVAQQLVRDGVAPMLVVSYEPELGDDAAQRVCERPADGVVCFRADPSSTRARRVRSRGSRGSGAGTTSCSSRPTSTSSAPA
jgi:hypothetical protein